MLYRLHIIPATWNQARKFCRAENATLAMPKNMVEADEISKISFNKTSENIKKIHIGFHDIFNEGEYVTENGTTLTIINLTNTSSLIRFHSMNRYELHFR